MSILSNPLIERAREAVISDLAAERPEVAESPDLREQIEQALLDLATAGQSDIQQLITYARYRAKCWLASRQLSRHHPRDQNCA
jgi:hypothetical protein